MSHYLGMIGLLILLSVLSLIFLVYPVIVYLLLYTQYWHITVLYLYWIYYDRDTPRRGGRRWDPIRHLSPWKWYAKYFPIKLVKSAAAELDPSKNYLLVCHPHGIFSNGFIANIVTEGNNIGQLFPDLTVYFLTLDSNYYGPILRDLSLMAGGCSASKESMEVLLGKPNGGNLVALLPGGIREMIYAYPGVDAVYLKNRKGFIRVAIKRGSPIIPMYTFGETETFTPIFSGQEGSWWRNLQEICMERFKFPLVAFYGRGIFQNYFGFLPRRHRITSVVGSPIEVKQMDIPSDKYVDELHSRYIENLLYLYNTNKEMYGNPQSELIIY